MMVTTQDIASLKQKNSCRFENLRWCPRGLEKNGSIYFLDSQTLYFLKMHSFHNLKKIPTGIRI